MSRIACWRKCVTGVAKLCCTLVASKQTILRRCSLLCCLQIWAVRTVTWLSRLATASTPFHMGYAMSEWSLYCGYSPVNRRNGGWIQVPTTPIPLS
jgi:hypothetical protein